jgi:hypothetical protein
MLQSECSSPSPYIPMYFHHASPPTFTAFFSFWRQQHHLVHLAPRRSHDIHSPKLASHTFVARRLVFGIHRAFYDNSLNIRVSRFDATLRRRVYKLSLSLSLSLSHTPKSKLCHLMAFRYIMTFLSLHGRSASGLSSCTRYDVCDMWFLKTSNAACDLLPVLSVHLKAMTKVCATLSSLLSIKYW